MNKIGILIKQGWSYKLSRDILRQFNREEKEILDERSLEHDDETKIFLPRNAFFAEQDLQWRFYNDDTFGETFSEFNGNWLSSCQISRILQSSLDLKLFFADFIFFQKVSSRAFHCAKQVGEKRCKVWFIKNRTDPSVSSISFPLALYALLGKV